MNELPDISVFDLKIRAQFLRDLFSRFVAFLRIHCEGYLLILSEQVDETYIRLKSLVELMLASEGFENLLVEYPKDVIPESLHALGEDADVSWEYGIQQSVNRFTGKLLEFCVNVGAGYDEKGEILRKVFLEPYDKFLESFDKDKRRQEKIFLAKAEIDANRIKQQFSDEAKSVETYVDLSRIGELRTIKSENFDLSKLIEMCEELNKSYSSGSYLAVAMLMRAILDHVPPIFGCKNFSEVSNNYAGGSRSFKQSMAILENSLRKIADAHLHTQIRRKETLPNMTQVNFRSDLDVMLAEIVRVLK